jgi:hypothetical protein
MNEQLILSRLRSILFATAALMFVGTIAELIAAEHTGGPVQLLPFALCGIALLSVGLVWRKPGRRSILIVRSVMGVMIAGSLFGIGQHIWNDFRLAQEFQPGASAAMLIRESLTGGVPILAPGILAAGAIVAIAATYGMSEPPAIAQSARRQQDRIANGYARSPSTTP